MEENYIASVKQQFAYYKKMGEKTFAQLDDDALFWQSDAEANSIAILVNHLWGNMNSRWTDFLTSDGEKEWRERDLEFENVITNREELLEKWHTGWQCVFDALDTITPEKFHTIVYIRNKGHTVVEAINRQLAHYAYHIGQIVFIARMFRGSDWQSLTIARGKSKEFNAQRFAQEQRREHFTEEFLKDKSGL